MQIFGQTKRGDAFEFIFREKLTYQSRVELVRFQQRDFDQVESELCGLRDDLGSDLVVPASFQQKAMNSVFRHKGWFSRFGSYVLGLAFWVRFASFCALGGVARPPSRTPGARTDADSQRNPAHRESVDQVRWFAPPRGPSHLKRAERKLRSEEHTSE